MFVYMVLIDYYIPYPFLLLLYWNILFYILNNLYMFFLRNLLVLYVF